MTRGTATRHHPNTRPHKRKQPTVYNCPNCRHAIGYMAGVYLCPTTRAAAPPHQPLPRNNKPPRRSRDERTPDRGHRATKRKRTKRPPTEVTTDYYDTTAVTPADA